MKFILGEKLGMTQIFDKNGNVVPVTLVHASPNVVAQIKTKDRDGYAAVQVGRGSAKRVSKSVAGHLKDLGAVRTLREYRDNDSKLERGALINVSIFAAGEKVKVTGISKSKGFQGVVKRHGFHGAPATHGTKHAHREPGSIGATWPQRVIKGMRMAGRMGGATISVRNIEVAMVDAEKEIIALKGAVPGRPGTVLAIQTN
ncbi:MAG: 50S ribosomal protein L3 [Candidatus Sungbacteria bacterium]|uniref:Large ribosomal subunit protein uL3 n=1 Tax=Candidatus Sungiibacteriota bacterium TaxID=2750080 RepID=A0A9D6LNG4_9BACT|nr:50S ribosomal protein L3 [Candidatus Sungbacteria bacterium]